MLDRKLLIVAYHFPPDATVGALRPSRLARALPAFNWRPFVLTAKRRTAPLAVDQELMSGLEPVRIVRTPELRSLGEMYRTLARRRHRGANAPAAETPAVSRRRFASLKRHLVSLLMLLPDEQKGWAITSAIRAIRLVRKERIDCVLTSTPPPSVHFIGIAVKAFTRARWIADFRDPWLENLDVRPPSARSRVADAIERRMERAVVQRADLIVTTTQHLADALRARYPELKRGKVVCIPNSVDIAHFASLPAPSKYEQFTITYAGTLYEGRTPEPLFRAIARLLERQVITAGDVRLRFVGHCESVDGVPILALARQYGVESMVDVVGVRPLADALQIMRQSHLLLVLSPRHHQLIVPAKVYDYLGSGTRILAIAEPGATADFVVETGSGACFSHTDTDGLSAYLSRAIASRGATEPANDVNSFRRFDVSAAAARLAAELSALCDVTRPARA